MAAIAFKRALAATLGSALVGTAAVAWLSGYGQSEPQSAAGSADAQSVEKAVERGAYLAAAGNCAGCHTARGGAAMAGGKSIATPFGTVYAGNLTPDAETGLGLWTADDFWRALHHGRARDGHFLLPAFPYPQYTRVNRADADAMWAWLRSLPAVRQANRPHELRFPYGTQAAQAVWRALYFRPAPFQPTTGQTAEWNRGAYLVEGLGHCAACHAARNVLGATSDEKGLGGGQIPMQGWYAPSLSSPQEAGVAQWPLPDVVALLQTGSAPQASVLGPMAEVVFRSTQHLSGSDLQAMAVYLQGLPQHTAPSRGASAQPAAEAFIARGAKIYDKQCAACHGAQGEGAPGAYPPLAGNRALSMPAHSNLVRVLLAGGFPPATAGNPRPYGMPPFAQSLSDEEAAAVLSFIRQTFGGGAAPVSPLDVQRLR